MEQRRSHQEMREQKEIERKRELGDPKGTRREQIEPRHRQRTIEASERDGKGDTRQHYTYNHDLDLSNLLAIIRSQLLNFIERNRN